MIQGNSRFKSAKHDQSNSDKESDDSAQEDDRSLSDGSHRVPLSRAPDISGNERKRQKINLMHQEPLRYPKLNLRHYQRRNLGDPRNLKGQKSLLRNGLSLKTNNFPVISVMDNVNVTCMVDYFL
jgi:hypothetical protein